MQYTCLISSRGLMIYSEMLLSSVLFFVFVSWVSAEAVGPRLCVPNLGCMEGVTKQLPTQLGGNSYDAFLGVPYAQPPVGDLRFANPRPVSPWPAVLTATVAKPDCLQKNDLLPTPLVYGEENCLYLNIYRPAGGKGNKCASSSLPVMVYIYGGGFFTGSANPGVHGPEYFMSTGDVILVTMAYRLGALGFLSTGDDNMPGNFGLKDQSMALRWVKKHIASFNGNPDSITIFGQSAGAVSVHLHILSNLSAGLFNRAIVMSGNALAPFAKPIPNPLEQARNQAKFVDILDADTLSTAKLARALRQANATLIVNSSINFKYWNVDPLTVFRPVVEQPSADAFLTDDPATLISTGNYTQVPWLTGTVPNEGAVRALNILSNDNLRSQYNARFDELLEKLMELPINTTNTAEKMKTLVDLYLNGTHELNDNTAQGFIDMITDRGFLHPFYKSIRAYVNSANYKRFPMYIYKFNYRGTLSYSRLYTGNLKNYGVVHCDDLVYLFRSPALFGDFVETPEDLNVIKQWVELFVEFAYNGSPRSYCNVEECSKRALDDDTHNTICDYKELKNSGDSFELVIDNYFDISKVKLWDSILN